MSWVSANWGEILNVIIGSLIAAGVAGLVSLWLKVYFRPRIGVSVSPDLIEAEDKTHYRWWTFHNDGHATAHGVKIMMSVDTHSITHESKDGKKLEEVEGKTRTFIIAEDEEFPMVSAQKPTPAVRFMFNEGDEEFTISRGVKIEGKERVVDIHEAIEKFPASDSTIEIWLEGENLREKDREVRRFLLTFDDGLPTLRLLTLEQSVIRMMVAQESQIP